MKEGLKILKFGIVVLSIFTLLYSLGDYATRTQAPWAKILFMVLIVVPFLSASVYITYRKRKEREERGTPAQAPPGTQALFANKDIILSIQGVHGNNGYFKPWREVQSVFITAHALNIAENEEEAQAYRDACENNKLESQRKYPYSAPLDEDKDDAKRIRAIMTSMGWRHLESPSIEEFTKGRARAHADRIQKAPKKRR